MKFLTELQESLQQMNYQKDQFLFVFIRKYWPRRITPNQLTVARFIISAILFVILFNFKINNAFIIIPLFFVGILTDLIDGAVARGLDIITRVGEIIDPIADRAIIIPVAVYSLLTYQKLLLVLLMLMEIINALISLFSYGRKIFSGSNIFGKTKMVIQSIVFLAILLSWPQNPNIFFVYLLWVSFFAFLFSILEKIRQIRLYYANQNI